MPRVPALDIRLNVNYSPHVVILGAGASVAACPQGDANGLRLPLMADLVSVLGLEPLLAKVGLRNRISDNFEVIYEELSGDDAYADVRAEVEEAVHQYFGALQLPPRVTLYDQILLSLRPKDLVATFNWGPFLLQAYARNREMSLPRVAFLHGNVYLGYCAKHRTKGYSTQNCNTCDEPFQRSPLLFPITKKDYQKHPLLAGEWKELSAALEHAYLLTIFGYAAPGSDAAAREILLKAWDGNETRELAEVEVIDILRRNVLHERWKEFIVGHHWSASTRFSRTLQFRYPRRSCEAFAFATLQQDPWAARPLPRLRRLDRLQKWFTPLVDEERNLQRAKTPFEPFRTLLAGSEH
jgi:hypothetical protein